MERVELVTGSGSIVKVGAGSVERFLEAGFRRKRGRPKGSGKAAPVSEAEVVEAETVDAAPVAETAEAAPLEWSPDEFGA